MLLPKYLTTLALAASTTVMGSTLPRERPADGQYVGYINNSGQQVLEPFSGHLPSQLARIRGEDADHLSTDSVHVLEARHEPGTFQKNLMWASNCLCGTHLDPGNTDRAVQKLKDLCGDSCYVRDGEFVAAIDGDVIAFLCWGGGPVNSFLIAMACEATTDNCGRYVPGSVDLDTTLFRTPTIGYSKFNPGQNVCVEVTSSNLHECPKEG